MMAKCLIPLQPAYWDYLKSSAHTPGETIQWKKPYQTHCKQKPLSSSGDHAPTEWLTLGQSKTRTILNISLAYSKTFKK